MSNARASYHEDSEEDSLLPGPSRRRSLQPPSSSNDNDTMGGRFRLFSAASLFRWKAHPYWLIPAVLVMSMSRGITMSPRIQVYKAIACRALNTDPSDSQKGLPDLLNLSLNDLVLAPGCGDAAVQAKAAKIQASVVTTMSVLSAITTGFWSRAGDTHGRKPILAAFFMGALLMEACFVLVMRPNSIFGRHGTKVILLGPIIEGLVGGLSVFNGVVHAYVSDCTRHGSRSKIFSTIQGMVFVGLAIGPWFAGLFLPKQGYSDSFFYSSISLIFLNLVYILFICPESLSPAARRIPPAIDRNASDSRFKSSPLLVIKRQMKAFISAVLSPISMFAPRKNANGRGKNYTMTLVGLALFVYLVSTGVYSAKYIYAQYVFEWNTAELGYYMSTLWITRAFNLLVFLPIVISYLKPKPASPVSPNNPNASPNPRDVAAELTFDRYLAQISVGVDGLADALVALSGFAAVSGLTSRSQPLYYALSCLSSFTSGGNPALHSLGAVCLHACGYSSEVGTMFGAMAVLSAVAHIISPSIYAFTYSSTVASYPEAIFVLAACLLFSGVLLLSRVKAEENDVAMAHSRSPTASAQDEREHRTSRSYGSNYEYESIPTRDEEEGVRK